MLKQWSVAKLNKESAMDIAQRYDLPMLVSMMLDIRGITDENDIIDFFSDEINIEDPFLIKDMEKAVDRIKYAVENSEKICIFGDFDADGVTSTALLYSYLYDIGADVISYIPSREEEGYGMNIEAIKNLHSQNVKLIITVDNGIAAIEEVEFAKSLEIDVVITDHHTPPSILPDACAIVDLHQEGCMSKFKDLSGVGVALKLVIAIEGEYADVNAIFENYSDLAAIGTIGDIVSLRGENRFIVKEGLTHINNRERIGINALIDESGLTDKEITSGNVSFTLVPRINACGRLGLSKDSVTMLLSEDMEIANSIANKLGSDNSQRQQIEKDILHDINEMIKINPSLVQNKIIVIEGKNWHQGVIGIVASRLKDAYGKPSIVITKDGDIYRGSGRSVKGFSLINALSECSDLLVQYGGHPMAVGFGINSGDIRKFTEKINRISEDIPYPTLDIDCKLNPTQLSVPLVSPLSMMEPFGAGNPKPLFGLYKMQITDIKEISNGKHLKFTLTRDYTSISALKFNTTLDECPFIKYDVIDVAASLDINEYNGIQQLSIIIKDYKFTDYDMEFQLKSRDLFERFCMGDKVTKEEVNSIIPTRDEFALFYRYLKQNDGFRYPFEILNYRVDKNIGYGKMRVILEALSDLGLIQIYEGMTDSNILMCDVKNKVSLEDAKIIMKLREVSALG